MNLFGLPCVPWTSAKVPPVLGRGRRSAQASVAPGSRPDEKCGRRSISIRNALTRISRRFANRRSLRPGTGPMAGTREPDDHLPQPLLDELKRLDQAPGRDHDPRRSGGGRGCARSLLRSWPPAVAAPWRLGRGRGMCGTGGGADRRARLARPQPCALLRRRRFGANRHRRRAGPGPLRIRRRPGGPRRVRVARGRPEPSRNAMKALPVPLRVLMAVCCLVPAAVGADSGDTRASSRSRSTSIARNPSRRGSSSSGTTTAR